jgi:hypothetical protein
MLEDADAETLLDTMKELPTCATDEDAPLEEDTTTEEDGDETIDEALLDSNAELLTSYDEDEAIEMLNELEAELPATRRLTIQAGISTFPPLF